MCVQSSSSRGSHPTDALETQLRRHRLYEHGTSRLWKGSSYSITERRVPELIPVLGSQPAGDVSHKPDGRLPVLSARPAVTRATLKRAATNFAAWWTEAQWVWTVCLTQRRGCDLNSGPSALESSTLTTRLMYSLVSVIWKVKDHQFVSQVASTENIYPLYSRRSIEWRLNCVVW